LRRIEILLEELMVISEYHHASNSASQHEPELTTRVVSLANWLAHLPPKLVSAHLNIPGETLAKFPRGAQGIVPLP
jgi:hypothetical protein